MQQQLACLDVAFFSSKLSCFPPFLANHALLRTCLDNLQLSCLNPVSLNKITFYITVKKLKTYRKC